MVYPNFNEEKKLWKQGFKFVAGLDEVGRGPLAGPVVACAVVVNGGNDKFIQKEFLKFGVNDSKKLSAMQREKIFEIFSRHSKIKWGIGQVSEKVIDKINILEATKLAMQKALQNLDCPAQYLILDGNIKIDTSCLRSSSFGEPKQKSIVKGDMKVFSCALASVIAKVHRDQLMQKCHKKYPAYNFKQNKGYGTEFHIKTLQKIGPCKIHRKSFLSNFLES